MPDALDEMAIAGCRIRSPHRTQHLVGTVLKGKVKMRRKAARGRDELDDLRGAIHRFQRTDPEQVVLFPRRERANERRQRRTRLEIASVRAQVYAGNGYLAIARGYRAIDVAQYVGDRP